MSLLDSFNGLTPEQMGKELLAETMRPAWECNNQKALDLINKGATLDEKDTACGATTLIWATSHGHTDIAIALINNGALLDEKASNGDNALLLATNLGHVDIAAALINNGAQLDEKDSDGLTALMWALRRDQDGTVTELLLEAPKKRALALKESQERQQKEQQERAREVEGNVQAATILQQDVKASRPLRFRK